MSDTGPDAGAPNAPEWFARPDPYLGTPGLKFSCTMCGRCCTGPEGYVLVTDAEAAALARRLNLSVEDFVSKYTRPTKAGRSLTETTTAHGKDCVFLDRTTIPGKAVCGVYEDRPAQCRTWPFWHSNLAAREYWERASRTCPGINKGTHYAPQQIRILRDTIDM